MASLEVVTPMARNEGYGAVERVKGKESALDGEEMAAFVHEIEELKMHRAMLTAVGTGKAAGAIGKVQTEKKRKKRKARRTAVGTGKAASSIYKVKMEKMDKAPLDTGKAVAAIDDMIQMEKRKAAMEAAEYDDIYEKVKWCDLSDSAVGKGKAAAATDKVQMEETGKHRIPDEYVRLILALKREEPMEPEENPYLLPGCSVEEARRKHEEETVLFKRIYDDFEPFQAMVRKEWYEKGYVEVDYDYVAGLAKVKDIHKEDWDEWRKHQESLEIEYADSDDEDHAGFYVPYNPEELLEQFNLGEASQNMISLESN